MNAVAQELISGMQRAEAGCSQGFGLQGSCTFMDQCNGSWVSPGLHG